MSTNSTATGWGSVTGGLRSIANVFRNIFDVFGKIVGYLVDMGLTETQAWAAIVVLIIALGILASRAITKVAIVLIIIVVLFILASIFGVI